MTAAAVPAQRAGGTDTGIDLDGRWFRLVMDQAGDPAPYGQYHVDGDLVWAEFYAGGPLRAGRLIGTRRANGDIDAAYCLAMVDGELVAGRCVSVPETLPDGRIRVADHFQRADGSSGVSYIEEISAPQRTRED